LRGSDAFCNASVAGTAIGAGFRRTQDVGSDPDGDHVGDRAGGRDILNWAEAGVTFDNQVEVFALSVANTIVENVPEVFLFIALALLARQGLAEALKPASAEDVAIPPELAPE